MRYPNLITLSLALFLSGVILPFEPSASIGSAGAQGSAQEKAANLRSQLSELEARQSDLQARMQQLEESMKPENIERSLAGVGSLHPEDLREQRRRQLEIERNGVKAQLDLLTVSHSRLETALAQAEADAYRQSAAPVTAGTLTSAARSPSSGPTNEATAPRRSRRRSRKKTRKPKPAHHTQTSFGVR